MIAVLAVCLSGVRAQQFVCPIEGAHVFPHPTYCTKYVLCINGTPWELKCADGLHWSHEFDHCTKPELADCQVGMICPDIDDVNFPVIIPDEEDCERYNVCCDGEKVSLQCGPGLHFNEKTLHCDTQENADCYIDPDIDITITCPAQGTHFLPHPRDCHHYFICWNGEQSSIQACAPNTYWDAVHGRCDIRDNVLCANEVQCSETGVHFVPHPKSCSTYFMCVSGTANQLTCSPGTLWNEIHNYCDDANQVVCNFQCPSEGLHFFAHEFSCQHFFMCAAGARTLETCAEGLLFDPAEGRCDFAVNVECLN